MNKFKCECCGCEVYNDSSYDINNINMCERCIEQQSDKFVWSSYNNSYIHIKSAMLLKTSELLRRGIRIVYDERSEYRGNSYIAKHNKYKNMLAMGMYMHKSSIYENFGNDNYELSLDDITYIYVSDDLFFTGMMPNADSIIDICDHCYTPLPFNTNRVHQLDVSRSIQAVCEDCSSDYSYCETCNRYLSNDDMYNSDTCNDCYSESEERDSYDDEDDEYNKCSVCGNMIDDIYTVNTYNGAKNICSGCISSQLMYGAKLNVKYLDINIKDELKVCEGNNNMVFGIELETCAYDCSKAESIESIHEANEYIPTEVYTSRNNLSNYLFITKEDGSLPNNGYEISMQPLTLNAWHSQHIADVFETIHKYSRSYKYSECGIHISMPINILSETGKYAIQKFFINNKEFISLIAQRQPNSYCRYDDMSNDRLTNNHHNAIVFEDKRIEVRVFKSTTKFTSIQSYVEFLHALVSCIAVNKKLTFDSLVKYIYVNKDKYVNIHNRLKDTLLKKNICYYVMANMAGDYNE